MDAATFVIEAHKRLMELAVQNAAIGIKEQKFNGIRLGCMYGVGIGYYEAADAFRHMAIESGIVSAEEVAESNFPTFRRQVEEQGLALSPEGQSSVCPLDHFGLKPRNTSPASQP